MEGIDENKEETPISTNNKEESTTEPENTLKQPFKGIDVGKASIAIFMIAAALCALIGVYAGVQYTTAECNAQYQEFFDDHTCIEGGTTVGYGSYSFPALDVNLSGNNIEND